MASAARVAPAWASGLAFLLLLLAPASLASPLALPADPLATEVRAHEPTGIPAGGALDALSDAHRAYSRDATSAQNVSLDQTTVENALALSRASGVPFNVSDLAQSDSSRARTTVSSQRVDVPVENVLSALTLGVAPTQGALSDLLTRDVTYTTSDALSRRASLPDETAAGGLALLANGFALDPHALVSYRDVATGSSATRDLAAAHPDPRVVQSVSLTPATAKAALPLLRANGSASVGDLANSTLRSSDSGSDSRDVRLPVDHALLAIAMKDNGMPTRAEDVLDVDERTTVARTDQSTVHLDRGTVLSALLLGAGPG